jgi:VIT1/CCC1 family predicted Fe2+/Mn2+ transporter
MVADAEQDAVAGELAAAYSREDSLAKDLGRVKAENAELQTKLAKVTASLKNAKVTAREALIEMADQNAKLVQAFVEKKRECKQLKVGEARRHLAAGRLGRSGLQQQLLSIG